MCLSEHHYEALLNANVRESKERKTCSQMGSPVEKGNYIEILLFICSLTSSFFYFTEITCSESNPFESQDEQFLNPDVTDIGNLNEASQV